MAKKEVIRDTVDGEPVSIQLSSGQPWVGNVLAESDRSITLKIANGTVELFSGYIMSITHLDKIDEIPEEKNE